ncbi:hypothetical protein GN958_ATG11166 [Phytophthora infestans]|uniref:Uncharacterized protein n=1 Tax=Phytophthora infestans TaxID=4787 RepID=A0A8S9UFW0_PHYIN|nr:hypothetical protein GN958_ATG11166 [Phytophthora infestans]
MVIVTDKDSLYEVSTATSSSSDVFDFTELNKADGASGDEGRLLAFATGQLVNDKITSGVILWVKKNL